MLFDLRGWVVRGGVLMGGGWEAGEGGVDLSAALRRL